jgi:hypothetical protein
MPSTHKALGWISSILKQTKQKKLRKHRRIWNLDEKLLILMCEFSLYGFLVGS